MKRLGIIFLAAMTWVLSAQAGSFKDNLSSGKMTRVPTKSSPIKRTKAPRIKRVQPVENDVMDFTQEAPVRRVGLQKR